MPILLVSATASYTRTPPTKGKCYESHSPSALWPLFSMADFRRLQSS